MDKSGDLLWPILEELYLLIFLAIDEHFAILINDLLSIGVILQLLNECSWLLVVYR